MKLLTELARRWGAQTSYDDTTGTRRTASVETVLAVLRALGAPVTSMRDVSGAIRAHDDATWRRALEPVTPSWDGTPPSVRLRMPRDRATVRASIELEGGQTREWETDVRALDPVEQTDRSIAVDVPIPGAVPLGYHVVRALDAETMLVRAPDRLPKVARAWGVFVPLYALRTARDWGTGDLADLAALLRRIGEVGGSIISTLPLLARFDGDPSPYAPASRLFFDETWLDLGRPPDDAAPSADRADHDRVRALKRRALASLPDPDPSSVDDELDAYARFRAAGERHGLAWNRWPARAVDDVDRDAWRTHVIAQQLARAQLEPLRDSLLLDLPLGVHPFGFDPWRHPSSFAFAVHGGAPPDAFFAKGQDWEFPPLHPHRVREDRYRYPIACLRAHMTRARVLRIDHIMSFHRMWWIPAGAAPTDGAYVRSFPDEWYAIVALEARRTGCGVAGEDLGTVPREVRRSMGRYRVLRTYVLQEGGSIPTNALASLNTHDMPPFAAFWRGDDVEHRRARGLLDDAEAEAERVGRARARDGLARALGVDPSAGEREVLRAALHALAVSSARLVIPALEDLWGETQPQNMPGTGSGFGNWERRARYALEELPADAVALLREIGESR